MRILTIAAALATALNAGVFFDFSFVVMPGLRELPTAQAITAMSTLNESAVTPPLMLSMYLTAALCLLLIARAVVRWSSASPWLIGAGIAYLVAAVAITGGANVPISATIDALDPDAPASAAQWRDLYTQWVRWNHLRVVASLAAAVGFALAARELGRKHEKARPPNGERAFSK